MHVTTTTADSYLWTDIVLYGPVGTANRKGYIDQFLCRGDISINFYVVEYISISWYIVEHISINWYHRVYINRLIYRRVYINQLIYQEKYIDIFNISEEINRSIRYIGRNISKDYSNRYQGYCILVQV